MRLSMDGSPSHSTHKNVRYAEHARGHELEIIRMSEVRIRAYAKAPSAPSRSFRSRAALQPTVKIDDVRAREETDRRSYIFRAAQIFR
jgi:hypothetical protein